ncbi:MAG: HAD family hydrolase [Rhodospirillales bacterium]|nr:MAG: HAD family hydrolase [Rhodospirillales bacterium]
MVVFHLTGRSRRGANPHRPVAFVKRRHHNGGRRGSRRCRRLRNHGVPVTISTVLFDFDGTLVETMDLKVAAFRALYAPYGEAIQDAAAARYLSGAGTSRLERIRSCHTTLLGEAPGDAEVKRLSDLFGAMVEDKVVAAPWVPGAESFLRDHGDALTLAIVSATPQEELERIIDRRGITGVFAGILGSPPDKTTLIHDIISSHWIDPGSILMVGDGRADHDAAAANGVHFVGRVRDGQPDPFPPGTATVRDLWDLADHVERLAD